MRAIKFHTSCIYVIENFEKNETALNPYQDTCFMQYIVLILFILNFDENGAIISVLNLSDVI